MKVLHSTCQQIWKTHQWPQDWKMSTFIPIPKKCNAKECPNYHTIVLISHTSKVMLKVLQAKLQQYMNQELFKLLRDGNTRSPYLPPEKSYAGQEATARIRHGTIDWFQNGKGVRQGCILSPCLFNLYAEYIMRNARLDEAQAGIKIAGRNINNLRYADDTTLIAESEELKSPLMKLKEENEKAGLKFNIQKTKIMVSGPITSWQKVGEIMETSDRLYFRGLQNHCKW